jgi:predicted flap endonuclease-1-like 5' DNA nuclease
MKKTAKLLGFVGGALALLWAMRDRFISVATSREPESPHFRAVSPERAGKSGVDAIDGIGPVFATRLAEAGLPTVEDLAVAPPDRVAEAAGVSVARARSWIDQARSAG